MALDFRRMNTAAVTHIAAAVDHGIRVDQLAIPPRVRNADVVIMARHRCEVAEAHDGRLRVSWFPKVRDDGIVGVAKVDPLKTTPVEVDFMQSRFLAIDSIEIAN